MKAISLSDFARAFLNVARTNAGMAATPLVNANNCKRRRLVRTHGFKDGHNTCAALRPNKTKRTTSSISGIMHPSGSSPPLTLDNKPPNVPNSGLVARFSSYRA